MKKLFVSILLVCIFISTEVYAKENFFDEAKNKYDEKKIRRLKISISKKYCF